MDYKLLKNRENIKKENITLFCLPFAGGGASAYSTWIKKLSDFPCEWFINIIPQLI